MHDTLLSLELSKFHADLKSRAERDGDARYLLRIFEKCIEKMKVDREAGKRIQKRRIPKEYLNKFAVTNIWKINLDARWRMVYAIVGDEKSLVCVVIDVLDHKEYDRKFGYNTS